MSMHQAAHAFDRNAASYERGRPDYPAAAVAIIVGTFGITSSSTVLDLAAGTGKLTRLLVPTGAQVVAVEPMAGMRTTLAAAVPGVDVRDGQAENIPLDDRSVDAVTIGQAFHWFATQQALHEIHRVLRPNGGLALIWNRRDSRQPIQHAIDDLVQRYRGDVPAHRGERWKTAFAETDLFTPLQEWRLPHHQEVDEELLVDRVLSISFITNLPDAKRAEVEKEVRALAQGQPNRFVLYYVTDVYCCRAKPPSPHG
jgi:ubiquinone/menaquinone biosynthesis C-methylase UbiE